MVLLIYIWKAIGDGFKFSFGINWIKAFGRHRTYMYVYMQTQKSNSSSMLDHPLDDDDAEDEEDDDADDAEDDVDDDDETLPSQS